MAADRDHGTLLQFFGGDEVPPAASEIDKRFCELARYLGADLPLNSQKHMAMELLLQSRDAAVRAKVFR